MRLINSYCGNYNEELKLLENQDSEGENILKSSKVKKYRRINFHKKEDNCIKYQIIINNKLLKIFLFLNALRILGSFKSRKNYLQNIKIVFFKGWISYNKRRI